MNENDWIDVKGYFYHGLDNFYGCEGLQSETMVKILKEGIKTRDNVRGCRDEKYNHVCLYRKNNECQEEKELINSAYGFWIDHGFVFIINPELAARKATKEETNLVDEWRYYGDIPNSEFVGIAIPFRAIHDRIIGYRTEEYKLNDKSLDEDFRKMMYNLPLVIQMAKHMNLPIYDSGQRNYADIIDATLSKSNKK